MSGYVGDVFKWFFAAVLALVVMTFAVMFYHFQSATHYEHEANAILQAAPEVPSYRAELSGTPEKDSSLNRNEQQSENKAVKKLHRLDEQYRYIFTIAPQDKSSANPNSMISTVKNNQYTIKPENSTSHGTKTYYGGSEHYNIIMDLPMLLNYYGTPNSGNTALVAPKRWFVTSRVNWFIHTQMPGKTICQLDSDNT